MRSQLFLVDKSKISNHFCQFYFKLKIKCFHSLFVLYHSTWEPSHKSGHCIIQYIQAKNKRLFMSQTLYGKRSKEYKDTRDLINQDCFSITSGNLFLCKILLSLFGSFLVGLFLFKRQKFKERLKRNKPAALLDFMSSCASLMPCTHCCSWNAQ